MVRIFIGASWPYANAPIHVGGVSSSWLPPDIFARYHRMKGNDVLMVSGSDMHGTPITVKAEKEGVEPDVLAKRFHEINSAALKGLGIEFELFFYTDHENHKKVVHELFLRLHENGYIFEKTMLSPYCSQCKRFLPDRYVLGECPYCSFKDARGDQCDECGKTLDPEELKDLRCRICESTPEMRETKHLFFKLSAFQDRLLEYVGDKDYWKNNTLKFTRNWLESGLLDRPITRDLPWGIDVPLPGFEDKRIYVWFEAVMGYLSASKEWARLQGDEKLWEPFWKEKDSRHYYFIGKDNIPFHTIIWPAMLTGTDWGLNLPYDVPANEYMRLGKERFSKSRGVMVEIPALLEKYDPDALRYYFTIIMPEHRDAEFSWDEFFRKNNNELVSTYGNFVNRVLTFTEKNFGEVPGANTLEKVDEEFLEKTKEMVEGVSSDLEKCTFQSALKKVMALASLGNKYFDEKGPWNQIKDDKNACATTMNISLRAVRTLAIVTAPFLPFSASRLWAMLGCEGDVHAQSWDEAFADIPAGQKFRDIKPLFKKLEPEEKAPSQEISKGEIPVPEEIPEVEKASPEELPEDVPLEIRVGRVLEVGNHPNADKLYLMKVSLGEDTRTLVAGLKEHYRPDELEGKSIAILCNLKPAKIRGVESKGMLLAAEDDSNVGVLLAEGAELGDLIIGKDGAPEIPFSQFQDIVLEVAELEGFEGKRGVALVMDDKRIILKAGGKPVFVDKDIAAGSRVR